MFDVKIRRGSVKRREKLFREICHFLVEKWGFFSSRIYPISTLRVSTGILLSKTHFSTRK